MDFGTTLRLLRTDAGMTLPLLAHQSGTSTDLLRALEDGRGITPSRARVAAIAHVLRVPTHLLMELAQHPSPRRAGIYRRTGAWSPYAEPDVLSARWSPIVVALGGAGGASHVPTLAALLDEQRIVLRQACAEPEDAIERAAELLAPKEGHVTPSDVSRALHRREWEAPSTIGAGVWLPHAIVPDIAPRAALLSFTPPIDMPTPDGAPVRLVVALALDPAKMRHVHVLARIARLALPEVTNALCAAERPEEVLEMLRPIAT